MSGAAIRLAFEIATPRVQLTLPAWGPLSVADVEWSARSDCRARIIEASDEQWEAWRREGVMEIVKTGPHRTVYRLNLPEGEFYVKRFRIADWKARLRNLFRKSPADCEFHAAQKIAGLRLPTFDAVAVGRRKRLGLATDTYLVSEAIPEAIPLDSYINGPYTHLTPRRQASLRQRISRELGRIVARLHHSRIDHVDLHAGNLLIRSEAIPDDQVISLIDLHSVRFRRTLSQGRREKNLGALHQFFAGRTTRTDRLRFWLTYQKELQWLTRDHSGDDSPHRGPSSDPNQTRSWRYPVLPREQVDACRRLEEMLERSTREGWRRADRAWKRGNRHVAKLDSAEARCRGLATLDRDWLKAIRDAPEEMFAEHMVRLCKESRRHRVAEVELFGPEEGRRAYWKCVEARTGWRRLLATWRMSSVRRAWEIGHALLRRGIDTPRPLLFVEQAGAAGRSYLLTEAVTDSVGVGEFFEKTWTTLEPDRRSEWIAGRGKSLARQLRRMHDNGFDHRDLKFSNMLASTVAADSRIWLLDLDAVREWRSLPRQRAIQNLSRLNVSTLQIPGIRHTDRLRFLREYLGANAGHQWKEWWRALTQSSQKKIARNARRARPLS